MASQSSILSPSRPDPLPLAARAIRTRLTFALGDAPMSASGIAAVSVSMRSHFLDGLGPADRKTILAAATQRRFAAGSVITIQGHPADYLFLLTKGLARYFFVTEEGKKLLFQWLGAGD